MEMDIVFTGPLPRTDTHYNILADTLCRTLFQRVMELQQAIGETPADLAHTLGSRARQVYHADPNSVFDFFDKVSIDPAFMLDYVYHSDAKGGRPLLYTRKRFVAPFINSCEDYELLFRGVARPYLHHIVFEQSPQGVFEFLLFTQALERMLCAPAKLEGVHQSVFTQQQLDGLIEIHESRWCDSDMAVLRELDVSPRVQMHDNTAVVLLYEFSFERGLSETEYLVPYSANAIQLLSSERVLPGQIGERLSEDAVVSKHRDAPSGSIYSEAAVVLQQ